MYNLSLTLFQSEQDDNDSDKQTTAAYNSYTHS